MLKPLQLDELIRQHLIKLDRTLEGQTKKTTVAIGDHGRVEPSIGGESEEDIPFYRRTYKDRLNNSVLSCQLEAAKENSSA